MAYQNINLAFMADRKKAKKVGIMISIPSEYYCYLTRLPDHTQIYTIEIVALHKAILEKEPERLFLFYILIQKVQSS